MVMNLNLMNTINGNSNGSVIQLLDKCNLHLFTYKHASFTKTDTRDEEAELYVLKSCLVLERKYET